MKELQESPCWEECHEVKIDIRVQVLQDVGTLLDGLFYYKCNEKSSMGVT